MIEPEKIDFQRLNGISNLKAALFGQDRLFNAANLVNKMMAEEQNFLYKEVNNDKI